MSHRKKNQRKSRHRTHTVKPANLFKPVLPPVVAAVSEDAPEQETSLETSELTPSTAPAP